MSKKKKTEETVKVKSRPDDIPMHKWCYPCGQELRMTSFSAHTGNDYYVCDNCGASSSRYRGGTGYTWLGQRLW